MFCNLFKILMRVLINLFATKNLFRSPTHIFQQRGRLVRSLSSMSDLLVGVCQMTSGSDVAKNIESCKRLINKAKQRGAKVCRLVTLAWFCGTIPASLQVLWYNRFCGTTYVLWYQWLTHWVAMLVSCQVSQFYLWISRF